ncbi:LysM peptidoglycan-binding domain-containing protein [Clostridium psychrophilum]|nr:LysM peptidoglycan-binding domain-containing protein [Clostridium psychrophilum]
MYAASYKVKSGDSLYKVSKAYNTTTNVLIKNNGLSSSKIYSGQVLNVPTNTYKVVSGDTLYFIGKKHSISIAKLRTENNKWDDTIYPGDVIKIPTNSGNGQATPKKAQSSPVKATGVIKYSNSDVDLLARLITAEAVGEGHDAMLSVGAVVVNRVQSSQYANSISGVINEKSNGYYQFTPVKNGMINKAASKAAISAASEALKGTDPTNGALYFYDNTVSNKWLTSKPVSTSIGKLTFAF